MEASRRDALRVYVDGVFDLFHPGHLAFLEKARAIGEAEGGGGGTVLIVGVITDADACWKRPPVIDHPGRVAMVRACRLVDEVVEKPPLVLTEEFLDARRIDLVVHGDDSEQAEFFAVPRGRGVMRYVPYTPGWTTTGIIGRIGATRQEN